ncbi:hypothetical protein BJ165DRAFT_1467033 [Panaeolus papilionaceus]|nr:hypothetical protein BJ165DRAFT_1467033 [Panaeolus papilionaceus]
MPRLAPWRQIQAHSIDSVSATASLAGTENLTTATVESLESTPISSPSDIMWSDDNNSEGELDITTSPPSASNSPQQSPILPQSSTNPCIVPAQPLSSTSSPTEGISGDLGSASYVTETSRTSSPPSTVLPSVERLRELMESWEAGTKSPANQPIQEDSPVVLTEIEPAWGSSERPLLCLSSTALPNSSSPPISQPQPQQLSGSLLSLFFPDRTSPPLIPQIQSYSSTPSPLDPQVDSEPVIVSRSPPTHASPPSDDMDQRVIQVVNDDTPAASHEPLQGHAESFSTSIAETPALVPQLQSSFYMDYSLPSSRGSSVPPLLPDSYPYVAIPQSPPFKFAPLSGVGEPNSAQPILGQSMPIATAEGAPFGSRTRSSTLISEGSYNSQAFFHCPPVIPTYPIPATSGFPLTNEEDSDSTLTRTESPGQATRYHSPSSRESTPSSIADTLGSRDNSNRSDDESFGNLARHSHMSPWYAYVRSERTNRVNFADRERTVTPPPLPYGINTRTASREVRDPRPLPPLPSTSERLTSPWFYGPPINESSSVPQHLDVPSNWLFSPAMPICVLPPSAPPTTSPTPPAVSYIPSPPLPSPPLSFDHAFASLSLKDTGGVTTQAAATPTVRIPINDNSTPSGGRPPSPPAQHSWGMPGYAPASVPSSGVTPRLSSCYTGSTLPRDARLTAPPPPRSYTGMSPTYWGMSPNYGGSTYLDPPRDPYTSAGGYKQAPWPSYPPPPPTSGWSETRPTSYRKLRFAPLPDTPVYKNGGYAPSYAANNSTGYMPRRQSVNHLSPLSAMPFAPPLGTPTGSNNTNGNALNVPPRFPSPYVPPIIPPSVSGPSVYNYALSNNTTLPPIPPMNPRPSDFGFTRPWLHPASVHDPFIIPSVTRSKFFFEDGNLSFEVAGKSYMVHRHFFQQHSQMLRSQYGPTLPAHISLDSEITVREMENLLTIFYPEYVVFVFMKREIILTTAF